MKNRRTKSFYFKTGRCERLEERNMLSGHPIAAMFSPATFGFGFRAREAASFSVGALRSSGTAGYDAQQTVLTASLTDATSGATGTVTYSTGSHCGTSETELTVSATGATASASLDVSIGGTVVGTLTTDSTGAGTLVLSSDPSGTEQALPSNFPTSIAAGTAVTVGTLSGSFAASTSTGSNSGTSSGCSHSQATTLSASLTDSTGTGTGTATLTTKASYGTTTKLTVSVTGATASSSLDVVIDGTTVGTLTTDSTGAGTLTLSSNPSGTEQSLPSNFPTVNSGSTITVGSLSGTFATSTLSVSARFASHAHRFHSR